MPERCGKETKVAVIQGLTDEDNSDDRGTVQLRGMCHASGKY